MLRMMGAVIVVAGFGWYGQKRGDWYLRHLNCLAHWNSILREGVRQLCDLGTETGYYLDWISNRKGFERFTASFLEKKVQGEPFSACWTSAVYSAEFPLKKEEEAWIAALGTVLGQYDPDYQREVLLAVCSRLSEAEHGARLEAGAQKRIWRLLGVSAGLVTVILLY